MPIASSPRCIAERATARIAAFRPGQSPPAVRTPIRIRASLGGRSLLGSTPVLRLSTIPIALLLAAALLSGCGEGGAEAGARVTVYVSAPLHGAQAVAGRRLCEGAR